MLSFSPWGPRGESHAHIPQGFRGGWGIDRKERGGSSMSFKQKLAIVAIFMLLLARPAFAQQSSLLSSIDFLDIQAKEMLDHEEDFGACARSNKSDTAKWEVCNSLLTIASDSYNSIDAVSSLLHVYSLISSKSDRSAVRPFIQKKIEVATRLLSLNVKSVNLELAQTHSSAIALSGARLKEDLRKTMSHLNDFNLR
jgi:hypothetical protein